MDGDQRCRAGRLDVHAGTVQIEAETMRAWQEILVVAGMAQQEHADLIDQFGIAADVEVESSCPCRNRRRHRRAGKLVPAWPASSIASQAHSRKCRCWGSMIAASFGLNRRKPASNISISGRSARTTDIVWMVDRLWMHQPQAGSLRRSGRGFTPFRCAGCARTPRCSLRLVRVGPCRRSLCQSLWCQIDGTCGL